MGYTTRTVSPSDGKQTQRNWCVVSSTMWSWVTAVDQAWRWRTSCWRSQVTPSPGALLLLDPQLLLLTSSRSDVLVCCSPVSGSAAGVALARFVEVTGCPSASLSAAVMGMGASVQLVRWGAAAAEAAAVVVSIALMLVWRSSCFLSCRARRSCCDKQSKAKREGHSVSATSGMARVREGGSMVVHAGLGSARDGTHASSCCIATPHRKQRCAAYMPFC
jgi:hypothetical protein